MLKAFAQQKDLDLWSSSFRSCCQRYPELSKNRDIIEDLGLEIISSGIKHPSVTVRAMSILSTGLARDFRLEHILLQGFHDDSAIVRALSLQMSLQYGSENLKRAIEFLARNDDSVHVRMTAYKIAALLHIDSLASWLRTQATNGFLDGEERREALRALLRLTSQPLEKYVFQENIDQALFICEMLRHQDYPKNSEEFSTLISISHPEVQEAVLLAALACRREISFDSEFIQSVRNLAISSPFPKVQLQAAAFLYLSKDPLGCRLLVEGLQSPSSTACEAASVAVCSLGVHGIPLAKDHVSSVISRKASANLAVLLLVSREDIETSGKIIADYLENPEMCWAIKHFLWETQCNLQIETLPHYADMMKREIGRKLMHLLIVSHYSQAKAIATKFLIGQQQGWSFFSSIFWEEGDEQTSESFISDVSFAAQFEGALAEFCQKKDFESLQTLLNFFSKSRWQDKLAIIEGIAFSENFEALPFLLECCFKETPSLRSAAAGALFALYK
nr:HEAT repeat domain-containing protein [Chlamydia sp. 17-3921]